MQINSLAHHLYAPQIGWYHIKILHKKGKYLRSHLSSSLLLSPFFPLNVKASNAPTALLELRVVISGFAQKVILMLNYRPIP